MLPLSMWHLYVQLWLKLKIIRIVFIQEFVLLYYYYYKRNFEKHNSKSSRLPGGLSRLFPGKSKFYLWCDVCVCLCLPCKKINNIYSQRHLLFPFCMCHITCKSQENLCGSAAVTTPLSCIL